ncbi:unnamed protein product, partial [Mesorhabditis spiculigera]
MISLTRNQQLIINLCAIITLFLWVNHKLGQLPANGQPGNYGPVARASRRPGNIVIYNRVPKTGSTTFTNAVAYDMGKINGFTTIHLNMTKNRPVMSLPDQESFIRNLTTWDEMLPIFIHGHVAYVDFERFGYAPPIYINLLREPLERLLSHYYFLRYGDNYRLGLKRSRAGNNETFDQCIRRSGKDCDVKQLWLQITYFCGHHPFCSEVGNKLALETAKRHLVEKYLLVGTTDRIRDFIGLLDVHASLHIRELWGILTRWMKNKNDKCTGNVDQLLRVPQYHYEKIKTFH